MSTLAPSLLRRVAADLATRRDAIDRRLHAAVVAATGPGPEAEVRDQKDLAAEEADAALTDAELAQAAKERDEVVAALRRIDDGSYGTCAACGEPIPALRLQALPAAAFCLACQAAHERRAGTPR